jgi:hypothetical protein
MSLKTNVDTGEAAPPYSWGKALKILASLLLFGLLAWFLISHKQTIRDHVVDRDSIAYWAAAKLALHHQNPYAAEAVLAMEQQQGYGFGKPLVLRTPPWSLWMFLPLGLLDCYWAWVSWLSILIASLVISIRLCWRMYGEPGRPPTIFLVVAYLLAPVPACLAAGQMGLVLLLAIVLFLFLEPQFPFVAGAVLVVAFSKPHLFSALWLALAVWIVMRRKWLVLLGFCVSLVAASAMALRLDGNIFTHYEQMVRQATIQYEFIPAISGVIRLIFFRKFFWVQFVPTLAALTWAAWYYWSHRQEWDWRWGGPALVVVSIVTAPYAWLTDEAVVLPAVLMGVLWVLRAKLQLTWKSHLAIFLFACMELLLLLLLRAKIPFATGIYFWSGLLWAVWYGYARRFRERADS